AKGIEFEEREALVMALPHQPGQLASILTRLADEKINVLSCYCTVEKNQIVLTVDKVDRAKAIFRLA
ncbi:MAG: amino acid-binding protein, partial [Candidatus Bipolaricaulota bacterium]|nr:amino acid-binding protein [Candidatus Bipolaricaulota bacterium]